MIGEISKQKKKRYNLMSNQVYTFLCTLFVAIFYSTYTHKFNINETKNPKRRMPFDKYFPRKKEITTTKSISHGCIKSPTKEVKCFAPRFTTESATRLAKRGIQQKEHSTLKLYQRFGGSTS